jgi:DNA-binding SARP family transcriptional activator
MAELRINLLGPPELRWELQLLKVNRRIPRTLLFYLAAQDNYVGRGKLLTLFWEDSSTEFARRRLREALSRIRAEIPERDAIVISNDLVGLDINKSYVDQRYFLDSLNSIGNQPWIIPADKPLPEDTLQSMIRAVNLWHGSQFLEGAKLPSTRGLDDWWQQTNQHLVRLRIRLLARICDHYRVSGQLEDALSYARKALESDNLNEDLHLKVINLLVDMGDDQEARNYYSSVAKLLSDELDTQPSQQLVSIYRQIQKRTLSNIQSSQSDWHILISVHTPFVGRQAEIARLQKALDSGGGIIITGESGLGKTRLVQEFCELFASDQRIFVTHCRPAEINLPYQPIIEFLRNQVSTSEWQDLPKIWAEPLTLLLPELLTLFPALKPPTISYDLDQNRSTLLEAIRQVILLISQRRNLVLFLDDVQWADEASLSTISYLLERPPFDDKAMIILAARSDEVNPGLEDFLASNQTSPRVNLIGLERLSSKEISALGRYVMGYPLDQGLVDQLEQESGGNPFIILETLRSIQTEETRSKFSDSSSLPLAKSVYSLIKNRIEKLSPLARETSEFAAVIGPEFDPKLISIANQHNYSIVARAIEELKQRNIIELVNLPPKDNTWRFIHDKIRETLLLDTNPVRLQFIHEHIARAMETSIKPQTGSQAAILAHHYELAGKVAAALSYWLKAAQWARQLFSITKAQQIFSRAEKLIINSHEVISDELIHDFFAAWTEMAYEMQDSQAIREQNSQLLNLGRERGSQLLIGTALDGFSDASLVENKFEEGLAYTNQAISYLDQTSNIYEKMDAHIHRGVFLYMLGRINEAIQTFDLALTLSDSISDPQIQSAKANAHYQLALCQTLAGWPELGLKNATLSIELANRIGHHHTAITAYTASSLALYFMADYEKARRENQNGIEIAKRIKANRMLGYLYAIKGFLDNAAGDLGSAYDSAQLVYRLGEKYNHLDTLAIGYRLLGDIFLLIEAPNTAREYFQQGVNSGSRDFWELDNLVRLGYAQIRTNQTEIGMVNLHRGIDLAQSTGLGIVEIRGLQFLSYSYIYLNEWQLALQVSEKLERQASRRSMPLVRVLARFIGGIAESNLSEQQDIVEQLQLTLDALGDIEQPFIELRALMQMVRAKKASGLDPKLDIQRVNEILVNCESNAHPEQIRQAFLDYRKMVLNLISG